MTDPVAGGIVLALLAFLAWREWQHDRERQALRREAREERRGLMREALPHFTPQTQVVEVPREPYGGPAQEWAIDQRRQQEAGVDDDLEPMYV